MVASFFAKIRQVFKDKSLRNKVFFVIFALFLFRMGNAIPIPGVDRVQLSSFLDGSQFFGLLNIFSGGGLSRLSIMMLGVGPYITATIIMQLLTMVFPALKEMYHEEGEIGRRKFAQYSRLFSIPLAALQGFALLSLLKSQGVLAAVSPAQTLVNVVVIVAGSLLLMWIGELISEYGVGNGISLIIFAGIVAGFPQNLIQLFYGFDISQIPLYVAFVIVAILIIAGVVLVSEAERPIPVTYSKRVRGLRMYGGLSTYLPLRVNQAGVMPIIFALSLILLPQMAVNLLQGFEGATVLAIIRVLSSVINNQVVFGSFYFVFVVLFTYFYTAITFDPQTISENLQKSGAFIPGVRPGKSTEEYLGKTLTRLTLVGALFLGIIAILPLIMQAVTQNPALAIGGTGLLIAVSVVMDLVRQIDSQISMREY